MKIYKLYLVENKINSNKYVGITYKTVKERWYMHQIQAGCRRLHSAIKFYGADNFTVTEIYNTLSEDNINEMEQFFIIYYNTLSPNGYNLRTGGQHHTISEETRQVCSAAQKENWLMPGRKEKQSKLTKTRHLNEDLTKGLREESKTREIKVIGINFKTFEIIKFNSINDAMRAGYDMHYSLMNTTEYCQGYTWFKDEGQSDEYFIQLTKDKNIKTKGIRSWENCDREQRLKAMQEGSQKKALIAVSIIDGSIKEFISVHEAKRFGFSTSSIYGSLNRTAKTGQKHVWFYKKEESQEYYINETLKLIGKFTSFPIS